MEYIQGLGSQTRLFLYSLGFGFVLGIIYDIFRLLRMIASNRKTAVIVFDVLYFTVCGFLIFCFMLITDNGQVRMFVLEGMSAGWVVYYFAPGSITVNFERRLCKLKVKIVNFFKSLPEKHIKKGKAK